MIVVGLGYGDEGKGLVTSFLCSQKENPLVVRFNGGHQAGHTVVVEEKRHVFSHFGSGTLQGAPTYWSSYCTLYPTALVNEYMLLPGAKLWVHPLCPVTTPYDVASNHEHMPTRRHGTVGVGFGATLQRQEHFYKLYAQDLFYDKVLREKLRLIAEFYAKENLPIEDFLKDVEKTRELIVLRDNDILQEYEPVFEGAQGVLLDMDFGFFPHVTRSNTTTRNALAMYPQANDVYYVTRTYQTRHGHGFLAHENQQVYLVNNEQETNVTNPYQGPLRIAPLDVEMLNYALACDQHFSKDLRKHLVVTCMDQHPIDLKALLYRLNTSFTSVYASYGPSYTNVVQVH